MNKNPLQTLLNNTFTTFEQVLNNYQPQIQTREIGIIKSLTQGIANISGLPNVKADELLRFSGDILGIAFNLDANEIGVILLGNSQHLAAGQEVQRTGRVLDVPVGEGLLGRVLNVTGQALDNQGAIQVTERRPVERQAAAIMDRAPVTIPLQTGIKVVDALVPIGRGQRELIVGDRQIGKTAIATDTIINQKQQNVICIYCAIGKRASSVAKVIADLRQHNAMDYTIVVVASGEDPPGLQYITPYAATTIAEYFMEKGRDVLIVYDDLTHHAWAYRELSLLLRRPPGREAYPGDIFYIHSRLLERATHLRAELGGGSLTALPIVETQAQNLSAYIPTNLISITDGQIYLSPDLFQKGVLPAVDVGKSVSRVGGKTQLPAYSAVAGDLRLSYSQFQEVEVFARFGTQLDEETRQTLERGRRVREILKQPQYQPLPVAEQIAVLLAVTEGIFDDIPLDKIQEAARAVRQQVTEQLSEVSQRIQAGEKLSDQDRNALLSVAQEATAFLKPQEESENAHH
ncbi:alternate F1F0 ATPase, F1 subunit alpha [Nodularia spumigena CS-584]|jgi:F-type H+/Na+-transporting ATPase subunit alpha|uniref:ATP synthase subunit alpha n=1 Tax=Nodularia spumigena UHCC 0039 TaxID=1914872 RepID=A0A2S0Q560_NODSP|nr:alternate F1F0 ATPase, F1 subunit alpha [Nodularia spumigena]AHJ26787.1 ATP synthase alpha chain [Nodularia spumigena CCY9414]AVZ29511.1 ATP synthase subunit alpha [Nodularia spumigena UHCC 0039]EAW45279.1 H(+)-transporting ATP synthase, subunit alpha [Nodularia spumigena CCY9414]MDB9382028.1 alternate F1F0 ATPase, F1 subunit alpha [Nodularia spumigena CS-584]